MTGWIIEIEGIKDSSNNDLKTCYAVSIGQKQIKIGTHRDMAKIYKSKAMADKKAEIIKNRPKRDLIVTVIEATDPHYQAT